MSHPRPHHIQQPRHLNPSSQIVSPSALSSRTTSHTHHSQQRQSRTQVVLPPATSQHPGEEGGLNDDRNNGYAPSDGENDQLIEETGQSEKRGPELLRDALEEVSSKRRRRQGFIRYVLLDN